MQKIQKHHLPNIFGKIGYTSLLVIWLLAISLVSIFIASYVANLFTTEKQSSPVYFQNSVIDQPYIFPVSNAQQEAKSIEMKLLIGLGIVTILGILSHYSSLHSSIIVRKIITKLHLKITISSLFCVKFILLAIGFLVISIMSMLVPTIIDLLPAITIITMISAGSFIIQLALIHTRKISAKQTL